MRSFSLVCTDRALRAPMHSPGRPQPSHEVLREFWQFVAAGAVTEDAGAQVGVSAAAAFRWFRHAGGMTPISLKEPTGRYLCFGERAEAGGLKSRCPQSVFGASCRNARQV